MWTRGDQIEIKRYFLRVEVTSFTKIILINETIFESNQFYKF